MISLTDIRLRRRGRIVLDGVSLTVGDECLALVGPSASGKSTILRVVLGLDLPERGVVRLDDRIFSDGAKVLVPVEERRVAMVFQDLALWPHLSIDENLAFGLRAQGMSKGDRCARISDALRRVGLERHGARLPGQLSGGERQRVAIARAIVQEPVALLLDEPLASVDIVLKQEILALLAELRRDRHLPMVYVTHDPLEAGAIADRVAVLEAGRVVQVGAPDEIAAAPASEFARAFARAMGGAAR